MVALKVAHMYTELTSPVKSGTIERGLGFTP